MLFEKSTSRKKHVPVFATDFLRPSVWSITRIDYKVSAAYCYDVARQSVTLLYQQTINQIRRS